MPSSQTPRQQRRQTTRWHVLFIVRGPRGGADTSRCGHITNIHVNRAAVRSRLSPSAIAERTASHPVVPARKTA